MLDTFDSRALRQTDCYGQRFMKAGVYRYHVLPVGGEVVTEERPYTIEVVEGRSEKKMTQRRAVIRYGHDKFRVEPSEIKIEVGDLVLWNCPQSGVRPYVVVGEKEFLASTRMVNESGYTHAFAHPGEYRWEDAYGSGAGGVIRVNDPGCKDKADVQRWYKQLRKGALVTITGSAASPKEVEIVTGQTVFFAVTKGPGISITDARLLARNRSSPATPDGKQQSRKKKS